MSYRNKMLKVQISTPSSIV